MSVCACLPCLCLLRGLYRAYDTVTIVLTIHSSLSCDDDYPYGGWAIISDKGG